MSHFYVEEEEDLAGAYLVPPPPAVNPGPVQRVRVRTNARDSDLFVYGD